MEAVQGKELERILKEEGVTDEDDPDSNMKMGLESGLSSEYIIPDEGARSNISINAKASPKINFLSQSLEKSSETTPVPLKW